MIRSMKRRVQKDVQSEPLWDYCFLRLLAELLRNKSRKWALPYVFLQNFEAYNACVAKYQIVLF